MVGLKEVKDKSYPTCRIQNFSLCKFEKILYLIFLKNFSISGPDCLRRQCTELKSFDTNPNARLTQLLETTLGDDLWSITVRHYVHDLTKKIYDKQNKRNFWEIFDVIEKYLN